MSAPDIGGKTMIDGDRPEVLEARAETEDREGYQAPEVQTFTPEQLQQVLGPAQGYGGGTGPGRRTGVGRGHRLFPGLR